LESPEPFSRVVLADFGIAKSISSTRRRMFTTVGTPEYCAPEVGFEYTKIPESTRTDITSKVSLVKKGYDHKCDIWSLGIIVHIMLSGVSPFYEDGDEVKIIQSAKKGVLNFNLKQWRGVSSHAKDFVQSLLYVNIANRLSIEECFEHQWIKKHESELKKIYERVTH
jgi:meiosis-specific serine/threonine-protein kinase MEK1